MVAEVADDFDIPCGRLNHFLQVMASADWLVNSEPAGRFNGIPSEVAGIVAEGRVTFAAPVGLLPQGKLFMA